LIETESGKLSGDRLEGTQVEANTAGYFGNEYLMGFDVRHA